MSSMMWCLIAMSGCIGAWDIPSLGWSSCARFYVKAVLGVSHMFWNITGWWFGTWILWHILGKTTSQLTNSYFSEGLNQPTRLCLVPLWTYSYYLGSLRPFAAYAITSHPSISRIVTINILRVQSFCWELDIPKFDGLKFGYPSCVPFFNGHNYKSPILLHETLPYKVVAPS